MLHKKGGKCAYKPLQLRIILSFMGNIRCHLRWPLGFAWKQRSQTFKGAAVKVFQHTRLPFYVIFTQL